MREKEQVVVQMRGAEDELTDQKRTNEGDEKTIPNRIRTV
jgi:hypothetical protein